MLTRPLLSAVFLSAFTFTSAPLFAADAPGVSDPPMLKRVTGSEIIWGKFSKFNEMTVALEKVQFSYAQQGFKETKKVTAEGAHTILYYRLAGDVSTLEAIRQYEADLKEGGFEVLFTAANDKLDDGYNRFVEQIFPNEAKIAPLQYLHQFNHDDQRYTALKGKAKNGADVYITLYAFDLRDTSTGFDKLVKAHGLEKGQTVVRVDVLETAPMEARMEVVKAEKITESLDTTGRMAIYGVYFDTDKAEIKPESAESLEEMAKAIRAGEGRYLIVGHTDNQGDYAHNESLSVRRAKAVTTALTTQHQIDSAKLIPVGVGMAAPVTSNADEAGRAKNRRVEIVKM